MTNCEDLNRTLISSIRSGDEQSSDDDIKTLDTSSGEQADIDTSLASVRCSSNDIVAIYNELLLIRTRLAEENERLKKKDELLIEWEKRMRSTIEQGWQAHKDKFDGEINSYKEKINVLNKELKRTNESLQILRDQNNELKRNFNELKENHEKLIEKTKQTEKRAENLLRLNQIAEQKSKTTPQPVVPAPPPPAPPIEPMPIVNSIVSTTTKSPSIASTDSLIFIFNWLSDNAQHSFNDWPNCSTCLAAETVERYGKLIAILSDQTSVCFGRNSSPLTLAFLKLIYFSLITIECPTSTSSNGQNHRVFYSSSYRRLCEQILKCEKTQERPHLFDDSQPLIRLYSCLIVLLTCNKIIDLIASYNQLRLDLNTKSFVDLFVSNWGVVALYRWLKPPSHHRRLIFDTIDLLLLLCVDSKSLGSFLKQLSNETWFQLFYQLAQQCQDNVNSSLNVGPTFDLKTMEKLAILFEKLSELNENRRLFVKMNFLSIFKDWKQKFVNESPFLVLNMKSTLLNLEEN